MSRVKREYQSWVANESLEDYALRYTASSYRRWKPAIVANTALGGISFLAFEAIGASITLSYGFQNAMAAIAAVSLVIFLTSLPIAYWCSVANVDIDLLTRGAGFGYIGSTITSVIYASFTLIFFALETAIWAQALQVAFGLRLAAGYLLCSLVILPMVFFGVTLINKLQAWTQPLWIVLLVAPFAFTLYKEPALLQEWASYAGRGGGGFDLLMFGTATGVLFSLVAQIGEQADYLRFLPDRTPANRRAWWAAMLGAGPGWIAIGALKVSAGSLLAVLAVRMGSSASEAVEPVHMFANAYRHVVSDPWLALAFATLFVSVSQIKINVTNAYSGSLAWSNCFVRLAHYHPGRVVWLVFNVVMALLLSLLGIFETLQTVLSIYSTVALAWIGALVADLTVLKRTGISPPYIEFKRAHLFNFNPVGCGATLFAAVVAILAYGGAFGAGAQAFCGFIALAVAFLAAIAIGHATRGRYYIARPDLHYRIGASRTLVECCICEREYEAPDMAYCPFYSGPLCSLCCGLELHCHDYCKRASRNPFAPARADGPLDFEPHQLRRIGRFLGLLCVVASLLGATFLLTYRFMGLMALASDGNLPHVMVNLYIATLGVASLGVWWMVLSIESQEQTERELLASIQHLEQTRKSLVETEKLASLGGLVAGVAHEINTPAGIIVSAASFLSDRTESVRMLAAAPDRIEAPLLEKYLRDAAEAARLMLSNARRIAQLVLNFKQLTVDRITEARRSFDLREQLHESMAALGPRLAEVGVSIEATAGIRMESYPGALAQVVTNLAVNSLQHAFGASRERPRIAIRAQLNEADEVRVEFRDNGRGIDPALRDRVFEPFFTTRRMLGGTGMGLYIVNQIVTRQLGGTITLEADDAQGVCFVMHFPRIARHAPDVGHILAALPQRSTDDH